MRTCDHVGCVDFPCQDVNTGAYLVPGVELDPQRIRIVMISEAAPPDPADHYYAPGKPAFQRTTVLAFNDAGIPVKSIRDILDLGVYLTTAVKCGKTGYGIQTATVKSCARLLADELALFPNARACLLMGDIAIKGFNAAAALAGERRVLSAGATYKIRGGDFRWRGARVFPSYLQVGPSFDIEKSKRRMIAQDIAAALESIA